jgi:hypothetical protein
MWRLGKLAARFLECLLISATRVFNHSVEVVFCIMHSRQIAVEHCEHQGIKDGVSCAACQPV